MTMTPLKAHRLRCINCMSRNYAKIAKCEDTQCESWIFRSGHNPNRKGVGRIGGSPLLRVERTSTMPEFSVR